MRVTLVSLAFVAGCADEGPLQCDPDVAEPVDEECPDREPVLVQFTWHFVSFGGGLHEIACPAGADRVAVTLRDPWGAANTSEAPCADGGTTVVSPFHLAGMAARVTSNTGDLYAEALSGSSIAPRLPSGDFAITIFTDGGFLQYSLSLPQRCAPPGEIVLTAVPTDASPPIEWRNACTGYDLHERGSAPLPAGTFDVTFSARDEQGTFAGTPIPRRVTIDAPNRITHVPDLWLE